ncbi:MAG TPA: L,D-transpeptidase family protein [Candidatus Limnocylindrales bacterium]|nr:L,D-transpeptidase family protein [Candidatus Limnocylindrales bacterium]
MTFAKIARAAVVVLLAGAPRLAVAADLEGPTQAPGEERRALVRHDLAPGTEVVGRLRTHAAVKGETFLDISRHYDLGFNEMVSANRTIDPWVPAGAEPLVVPTRWILPEAPRQGLVLNIPEMRLYYFPEDGGVVTVPVGLGREDWQTPQGSFRVSSKTVNPKWTIPESIRKERIAENGFSEYVIPGGTPENPLGRYRLELSLPAYGIHGSNKPWGVGMQVSHGCLRLYNEDIASLFPLVPVGTPGVFLYQPVKVAMHRGRVLLEVHEDIYGLQPSLYAEAQSLIAKRGWTSLVDAELLAAVVEAQNGVPTDVGMVDASVAVAGDVSK